MKVDEVDETGTETSTHESGNELPNKEGDTPSESSRDQKETNGNTNGESSDSEKESQSGDGGVPELKMENGEFTFEDLELDDRIVGTIRFSNEFDVTSDYTITAISKKNRKIAFTSINSKKDGIKHKNVRFNRLHSDCVLIKNKKASEEAFEKSKPDAKQILEQQYPDLDPVALDILTRIQAGVKNIWMVGPAGCGKSTIAQMVSIALQRPFFLWSCGAGSSAAEIIGYKYPERAATRFGGFYKIPSIMVWDEFTALDPSVSQIANAALANGMLEITTVDKETGDNLIKRSDDCIIIATSNTFGTGASLQYNANNQLDASTRDRFVGGVIEVDYNTDYESQYNEDVVNFVWLLRDVIKKNRLARLASTRMIIEGEKLKKKGLKTWPRILVTDWTDKEINLLQSALTSSSSKIKL